MNPLRKLKRSKKLKALRSKRALVILSLLLLVVGFIGYKVTAPAVPVAPVAKSVPFSVAERAFKQDRVTLLTLSPSEQAGYLKIKGGKEIKVGLVDRDREDALKLARKHDVAVEILGLGDGVSSGIDFAGIGMAIFLIVIIGFMVMMVLQMRGGRQMKIQPVTSKVSFRDVAGCGEVVQELSDIRDFLKNPKKYKALGARVPKGVMLYGPPGTGKTLVAKAIASEAGIPFFSVSGSDFVEMYVGRGAARIRSLFKLAKKQSPCIIFIDELDAVGRARGGAGDGGSREADQTLNQLLVEMDGFEVQEHPIIIIGASNRLDVLDPALLRPGRFDRHISVDAPDRAGRLDVLRIHATGKAFAADVNLEALAAKTTGMSGAELANVLNEAALMAARRSASEITQDDLEDGFVRAIAGAKKQNRTLSGRERIAVAYHEAAHALSAELLDSPQKVEQISILPRGNAAGFMIYSNDEDVLLEARSHLDARLVCLLAGRAAEEIVVGDVTTGAGDDLKRATHLVTQMVTKLGMGTSIGLYVVQDGKDMPKEARDEVTALLEERYQAAKDLLNKHRPLLDRVAQVLLDEETIVRERFLVLIAEDSATVAAPVAV
jgi:cell division protease FtsH